MRDNESHCNQMQQASSRLGDLAKAAAALPEITAAPNPPLHLLLWADAYGLAENTAPLGCLVPWKELAVATAAELAHAYAFTEAIRR